MKLLKRLACRVDTMGSQRRMREFREGWAASASPDIHFFRSPKVQYRYRMKGDGPVIVFAVDPPVTLELYDELIELFAQRFQVVVMELPGMGFSAPQADFLFGWQEMNDDVALFLQEVAGPNAILAFSCVAGLAAVDIAVRFPSLVSKLVLLQTGDVDAFAKWKAHRDPKKILAKPFVGQFVMKKLAPKRMPQWFKLSLGNKEKVQPFCDCAAESFKHGAMWSLASAYQTYMNPSIILGKPTQPVLALWGLADRSHPAENSNSPKTLANTVTYKSFEELGHFSELEDPARVYAEVCKFVYQDDEQSCA